MLLEEFWRLHPDVVLLDIAMPLLNGLDAGRQLNSAAQVGEAEGILHD
jgi:CheY-like chemotaxis protein